MSRFDVKFDGVDPKSLKKTIFGDLGRFQRFFTEEGKGYSKDGHNTCVDDYSLRPIGIDPNTAVWIK